MKGIEFVVDDEGERKSVLIELAEHGELWEDIYDALLATECESEPRDSLAEVKAQLNVQP